MEYPAKPWYKKGLGVIVVAIILFLLATSAFYFIGEIINARNKTGLSNVGSAEAGKILSGQKYEAVGGDNFWLGSPDAKITIVEFGDFACPVCEKAFPTARKLTVNYKNDIKFIWRDYPVVTDYSDLLALAGRCAGEQGLFWPFHDKLFQNQGVNRADQLIALANQIGADTIKFKDCLDKQKFLNQIKKDLSDGQDFNIAGTPTYFINGYKVEGDMPYDTFVKIIEELKK